MIGLTLEHYVMIEQQASVLIDMFVLTILNRRPGVFYDPSEFGMLNARNLDAAAFVGPLPLGKMDICIK